MLKVSGFLVLCSVLTLSTSVYAQEDRNSSWDDTVTSFGKMMSGEVNIKDDPDYLEKCSKWDEELVDKNEELKTLQKELKPVYSAAESNSEIYTIYDNKLKENYPMFKECEQKYNKYGNGIPLTDRVSERCKNIAKKSYKWTDKLMEIDKRHNQLINDNIDELKQEESLVNEINRIKNNIDANDC